MKLTDQAMSAVLLCSHLGISSGGDLHPLTLREWNAYLKRTRELGCPPSVCMDSARLGEMGFLPENTERIRRLAARGGALAFALDDLDRRGIGILTQFDPGYPHLLLQRLSRNAPPLFFYAGDPGLARQDGIGVVGSRDIDGNGIHFTRQLVRKAAAEGLIVYSGGARGVDSISEQTAAETGSAVVSFLPDSMLTRLRKKEVLDPLLDGRLLLLSDQKPDAGFSAGRAMNRNKFIYAASQGTFVVASDLAQGGTWSGAAEAIRHGWTRVFVWDAGAYPGNPKLIEKGAEPYSLSEKPLRELLQGERAEQVQQTDLFSCLGGMARNGQEKGQQARAAQKPPAQPEQTAPAVMQAQAEPVAPAVMPEKEHPAEEGVGPAAAGGNTAPAPGEDAGQGPDLYRLVAPYIAAHIGDGMTKEQAARAFEVTQVQMQAWLRRMCEDGLLKRVKGRYQKP